jgi:hypothetical protein
MAWTLLIVGVVFAALVLTMLWSSSPASIAKTPTGPRRRAHS